MFNWIGTGLTLLGVGQNVYEWIARQTTEKEIEKLSQKVDKINEVRYSLI